MARSEGGTRNGLQCIEGWAARPGICSFSITDTAIYGIRVAVIRPQSVWHKVHGVWLTVHMARDWNCSAPLVGHSRLRFAKATLSDPRLGDYWSGDSYLLYVLHRNLRTRQGLHVSSGPRIVATRRSVSLRQVQQSLPHHSAQEMYTFYLTSAPLGLLRTSGAQ